MAGTTSSRRATRPAATLPTPAATASTTAPARATATAAVAAPSSPIRAPPLHRGTWLRRQSVHFAHFPPSRKVSISIVNQFDNSPRTIKNFPNGRDALPEGSRGKEQKKGAGFFIHGAEEEEEEVGGGGHQKEKGAKKCPFNNVLLTQLTWIDDHR